MATPCHLTHLNLVKIVALISLTCYILCMRQVKQCYELLSQLKPGEVYSWDSLKEYSNSLGRDVKRLLEEGLLNKVGPGLYLRPQKSRYGLLPANERQLVSGFLKTDDYLMFSPNDYNSLRVGLTQLRNETFVYNNKRHEKIRLGRRNFNFKRPNNGFPKKLTKEFLLVDLINNLDYVGEPQDQVKESVARKVQSGEFDKKLLLSLAKQYGKVGTRKFFNQFELDNNSPDKRVA